MRIKFLDLLRRTNWQCAIRYLVYFYLSLTSHNYYFTLSLHSCFLLSEVIVLPYEIRLNDTTPVGIDSSTREKYSNVKCSLEIVCLWVPQNILRVEYNYRLIRNFLPDETQSVVIIFSFWLRKCSEEGIGEKHCTLFLAHCHIAVQNLSFRIKPPHFVFWYLF